MERLQQEKQRRALDEPCENPHTAPPTSLSISTDKAASGGEFSRPASPLQGVAALADKRLKAANASESGSFQPANLPHSGRQGRNELRHESSICCLSERHSECGNEKLEGKQGSICCPNTLFS